MEKEKNIPSAQYEEIKVQKGKEIQIIHLSGKTNLQYGNNVYVIKYGIN